MSLSDLVCPAPELSISRFVWQGKYLDRVPLWVLTVCRPPPSLAASSLLLTAMQARIEFCCSSLYICHLFAVTPSAFIMRPTPQPQKFLFGPLIRPVSYPCVSAPLGGWCVSMQCDVHSCACCVMSLCFLIAGGLKWQLWGLSSVLTNRCLAWWRPQWLKMKRWMEWRLICVFNKCNVIC